MAVVADVRGAGGAEIGGQAAVAFTHGSDDPAPANLVLECDFDNDGDFDLATEDITGFLVEAETTTGRDYPSQLTGKAGPGQLRAALRNDDNRFSVFNQSSPLNQAPLALATGRKLRARTTEAADPDPVLLARDRFRRPDGPLTSTETGQVWETPISPVKAVFQVVAETAVATVLDAGTPGQHVNTIDVGAADYYVQIRLGRKLIANPNIPQVFPEVGVIYRYTGYSNHSLFRFAPGNEFPPQRFEMVDRIAGVETIVGSFELEAHAGMSLGVIVQDGWAIPVVDGVPRPGDGITAIGTATKVGIWGWWAGNVPPEVERIDVWDRFTVVDPAADLAPPFPAGTAASEPTTPTVSHVAPSVNAPAATDLLICAWQSGEDAPQTYTAPGSMTGAALTAGTLTDMLSAREQLAAAGPTGTRTATYGTADVWSAVSVIVHADTVTVEASLQGWSNGGDVTLITNSAPQAGWWLLAIQGGNQAGASSMGLPEGTGWELLADTDFADTSRIVASFREVTVPGVQSVTFPDGTLTDNHARLFVISGPTSPDAFSAVTEGVLWTGDIDDIKPTAQLGPDNTAALSGTGWLSKLATHKLQFPGTIGGRHTGLAVGKVLADSGLLYPPGGIDQGTILTGAVGFDELDAIEIARRFEETELGFLHESQEGWINFDGRNARAEAVSQATFSDAPGAQFGYHNLQLLDWRREIFNHVQAGIAPTTPSLPTGTPFVGSSTAGASTAIQDDVTSFDIEAGDLMVAFAICGGFAGVTWQPPIGWVDLTGSKPKQLNAGAVDDNFRVFAKPCDGTETGAQVFGTASSNVSYIAQIWLIKNWFRDSQGLTLSDEVAGSDPAPVSIGWAPQPGALLTCRIGRMGNASILDWSSQQFDGYSLASEDVQQGVAGQHMAIQTAWRPIIAAQTFNPAPFDGTFSGFSDVRTVTVAIRGFNGDPPIIQGTQLVTVQDRVSQDRHNAIKSYRNPANLYADQTDAEAYGDTVLFRHAQDRPIIQLSFWANINAAYRLQAIRRRVGHKITLIADHDTGMGVVGDFFIEHITHRFTDAGKIWLVTWELSPA